MLLKGSRKPTKFEFLDQHDYVEEDFVFQVWDKYAHAIGNFLIAFSVLEARLNDGIIKSISDRSDDTGFLVVERMTFANKMELYKRMYLSLEFYKNNKKSRRKLDKILNPLEKILIFRNNLVHADWRTLNKDFYVRTRVVSDPENGVVKFKMVFMPRGLIGKMYTLTQKLNNLIEEYNDEAFDFNSFK